MKKFLCLFLVCIFFTNTASFAQTVYYNTKTKKYHTLTCRHAKSCDVNCVKINKKEAQKRGGMPCKVCGR